MTTKSIIINGRVIGHSEPTYIIGEIGINHNGDLDIAKKLIKVAANAGVDAVKFQKRTPDLCVPDAQKGQMRETPWGYISYLDYRKKVEFGLQEYLEIDRYCKELGLTWFVSVWDVQAVDFMESLGTCAYKVPSASLTDHELLLKIRSTGKPIILSTGMSTSQEINEAVQLIGLDDLLIMHTTSAYPCQPEELNLKMIPALMREFDAPIGYSGHEVGLVTTAVAVALGACAVERHITLDRSLWGSDQAASVEPQGVEKLVKYIRVTQKALGDGVKHVYESELPIRAKLRK